MTVNELIQLLQTMPPDALEVVFLNAETKKEQND